MSQNNTAGYIGCGIFILLGLIFLPYVTIPILILAAIGAFIKKKRKKSGPKRFGGHQRVIKKRWSPLIWKDYFSLKNKI